MVEFYKLKTGKPQSICKRCHICAMVAREKTLPKEAAYVSKRKRLLKLRYGITLEEYEEILLSQGGKCKICETADNSGKPFFVDHCHTSGAVRGLLCGQCNTMLGMAKDSPELLLSAVAYLKEYNG